MSAATRADSLGFQDGKDRGSLHPRVKASEEAGPFRREGGEGGSGFAGSAEGHFVEDGVLAAGFTAVVEPVHPQIPSGLLGAPDAGALGMASRLREARPVALLRVAYGVEAGPEAWPESARAGATLRSWPARDRSRAAR